MALVGDLSCKQSDRARSEKQVSDLWSSVFAGTVAVGGACFFDQECAGHGICDNSPSTCFMSCCAGACVAAPPTVPLGGDCGSLLTGQTCAAGLACQIAGDGVTRSCAPEIAVEGASCGDPRACASPLRCVTDPQTGIGTCMKPAPTGAPCGFCDDPHDACVGTSRRCVSKNEVGSPCLPGEDNCVRYASCDSASMTCVERPKAGARCTLTGAPPCLGNLTCPATTLMCTLPAGSACI